MRPFQVGIDEFVEALFGGLKNVETLTGRDAGVVHEEVEALREDTAGKADERGAVGRAADVAAEDLTAGFGFQALRLFQASQVGSDDFVGL